MSESYVGKVYLFRNNKATDCEMRGDHPGLVLADTQINGKRLLQVIYLSSTKADRGDIGVEIQNIANDKGITKTVAVCNQNYSIAESRIAKLICSVSNSDLEKVRKVAKDYIDGKFDKKGNYLVPEPAPVDPECVKVETSEECKDVDYSPVFIKERKMDSYLNKLLYFRENINNLDLAIQRVQSNDIIDKSIENCFRDKQLDSVLETMISNLENNIKDCEVEIINTMNSYLKSYTTPTGLSNIHSSKNMIVPQSDNSQQEEYVEDNIFIKEYLENIIDKYDINDLVPNPIIYQSSLTKTDATKERILYLVQNKITNEDIAKIFNTSPSTIYRIKSGRKR